MLEGRELPFLKKQQEAIGFHHITLIKTQFYFDSIMKTKYKNILRYRKDY